MATRSLGLMESVEAEVAFREIGGRRITVEHSYATSQWHIGLDGEPVIMIDERRQALTDDARLFCVCLRKALINIQLWSSQP